MNVGFGLSLTAQEEENEEEQAQGHPLHDVGESDGGRPHFESCPRWLRVRQNDLRSDLVSPHPDLWLQMIG